MITGSALLLYAGLLFVTLAPEGLTLGYGSGSGSGSSQVRTWHNPASAETDAVDAPWRRQLLTWHARDDSQGQYAMSHATAAVPQRSLLQADSSLRASGLLTLRGSGSFSPRWWLSVPGPVQEEGSAAPVESPATPAVVMRRWLSSVPPQAAPQLSPFVALAPAGDQPAYLLVVIEVMPAWRSKPPCATAAFTVLQG